MQASSRTPPHLLQNTPSRQNALREILSKTQNHIVDFQEPQSATHRKHDDDIFLAVYHDAQVEFHLETLEGFVDENVLYACRGNEARGAGPEVAGRGSGGLDTETANYEERFGRVSFAGDEPEGCECYGYLPGEGDCVGYGECQAAWEGFENCGEDVGCVCGRNGFRVN